jgi:hypothetical protein
VTVVVELEDYTQGDLWLSFSNGGRSVGIPVGATSFTYTQELTGNNSMYMNFDLGTIATVKSFSAKPETELWDGSEATGVSVGGYTTFLSANVGTSVNDLVLLTYDADITSGGVNTVNFSGDTTVTTTGSYSSVLTADTDGKLVFQSSGVGFIGDITNVSVKRYVPNTTIIDTLNPETELVVNGDFDNGYTGWVDNSAAGGSTSAVGGVATLIGASFAERANMYQVFPTEIGKTYKLEVSCSESNDAYYLYQDANGNNPTVIAADTVETVYFVASAVSTQVQLRSQGGTSTFDRVSVKEYTNGTIVNGDDANWISSSPTDATIINADDNNWIKA